MLLIGLRWWSRCCSYYVWLCGLYYGKLHVVKSCLALCPRVFFLFFFVCFFFFWGGGGFIPFNIVITSLREEELIYVLVVHLFVLHVLDLVLFSSSW